MTPKSWFKYPTIHWFLKCFLVVESWAERNCSNKLSYGKTSTELRLVGVIGILACESWLGTSSTTFLVGVVAIVTSGLWLAIPESDCYVKNQHNKWISVKL